MLRQCPVDTRVELSRSIMVVGGASHLPGFNEALLGAMRTLCDSKFPSLKCTYLVAVCEVFACTIHTHNTVACFRRVCTQSIRSAERGLCRRVVALS